MADSTRGILGLRWTKNEQRRDPAIDAFRTLYQKVHLKEDDLAALAGLSTSTVKNMFDNKTMRPQHLTFHKLAVAMHHEYVLQPVANGKIDYASEITVAKEERKIYRLQLAKKRERATKRKTK